MSGSVMMLIVLCVGIPAAIYRGWALSLLWGWFFVPLGLPPIGIVVAIGISLTVNFLSQGYIPPNVLDGDDYGIKALVYSIMLTTWSIVVGWIVAAFL